jgi:Domain of Unknown Function (DUF930)
MQSIGHSTERPVAWGIAASLILHLALGLAIALLPSAVRVERLPEADITVEIAPFPPPVPPAGDALQPRDSASTPTTTGVPSISDPDAALRSTPDHSPPRLSRSGMLKATQMLSEQWLADPRSQQAKIALPFLADDERMEQLCAIEAMAQIKAWNGTFQPDHLVAYAMAQTKVSRNALLANGAAFHSNKKWYSIRFKCDLTTDHRKVVSFEFVVGDVVPRSEWANYNLPAEAGSLD